MDTTRDIAINLMNRAWKARAAAFDSGAGDESVRRELQGPVTNDLSEAVRLLRSEDASHELVHALRRLGHVKQDLGATSDTKDLYEEAVLISRGLGSPALLGHSMRHLGDHYMDVGDVNLAEPLYIEAVGLYRAASDAPVGDFANALRRLAILQEEQGRLDDALKSWEETCDLYAKIGLTEGVEECGEHISKLNATDR